MSKVVSFVRVSAVFLVGGSCLVGPANGKQAAKPVPARAEQSKQGASAGAKTDAKSTARAAVKADAKADAKPGQGAAGAGSTSSSGSITAKPVGAKSIDELVKKVAEVYANRDDKTYITLIKAPLRTRIRLHHQFRHDMKFPTSDFRFVTLEQEAKRFRVPKDTIGKRRTVDGVIEEYPLPVVGFIDFDAKGEVERPSDSTDIHGFAVGKDGDNYFIVVRQPVEGAVPAPASAKGPAPSGGSAPPAPVVTKAAAPTAAPAKPH